MILKKVLKKILGTQQSNLKSNNKSAGKIIEFIGPSGVGKTTLFNATKDKFSQNWNVINEFSNNQLDLGKKEIVDLHWALLKNKISIIDKMSVNSSTRLELLNYFNSILCSNIKLIQTQSGAGYILEEGLCHNFFEELCNLKPEELSQLLENRSLICVLPRDVNTVVNQIKKRTEETRQTVFYHRGLDDAALKSLTNNFIKGMGVFLERAQSLNISVCKVFIEDGLDFNSNKIMNFEKLL